MSLTLQTSRDHQHVWPNLLESTSYLQPCDHKTGRTCSQKWVPTEQNGFLFNHMCTTPFSTKGLKKSLCDFTGSIFVQCENPVGTLRLSLWFQRTRDPLSQVKNHSGASSVKRASRRDLHTQRGEQRGHKATDLHQRENISTHFPPRP